MNNTNILVAMDFDATLYLTPEDTLENRELLRIHRNYEKSGWWGRRESLDLGVFDIPINTWTKEKYDHHTELGHRKFMITGRIGPLKQQVLDILDQDNLEFDEYHFSKGNTLDFKLSILDDMVKRFPDVKEIYFYDDRTEHIPTFRKWGDNIEDEMGIKFRLFHVIGLNGYELKYGKKMR